MSNCWFKGKTVVITGASSGIGEGLTKKLIEEYDCRVIGVARNVERLNNLKNSLGNKKR